jgi:hypothetical protein
MNADQEDCNIAEAAFRLAYTQSYPIISHCSPLLALLAPCSIPKQSWASLAGHRVLIACLGPRPNMGQIWGHR